MFKKSDNAKNETAEPQSDTGAAIAQSKTPSTTLSSVTRRVLRYFSDRDETVTAGEVAAFLRCVEPTAQRECDILLDVQFIYTCDIGPKDPRHETSGAAKFGYKITTTGRKSLAPT